MCALCFFFDAGLNMQTQLSFPCAILASDLEKVSPWLEPSSRTIGVGPYFDTNAKPLRLSCTFSTIRTVNKAYFIRVAAGYRLGLKQADPATA